MATQIHAQDFGQSGADRGNLVGVQPYMTPADFVSEATYYAKLKTYMDGAREQGWLGPRAIVVFPEYVGTWLVAAEERAAVYNAKTIDTAMLPILLRNFGGFVKFALRAPARDRIKYALFRVKAPVMLRIYHRVFSRLAKEYAVTIVAGSIVLPQIEVTGAAGEDGVRITGDKLYNTTLMYRPDGSAYPQVLHKIFPTPQELPFTEPGLESELKVYDTPAGRLGVLNCADSWYPTPYLKLKEQGAQFLAVASFVEKDGDMHAPWRMNNITPPPPEFDRADYLKITYDDAWLKYALAARYASAGITTGINVFLRGKFWNLGSDGSSVVLSDRTIHRGKDGEIATLQNVWL